MNSWPISLASRSAFALLLSMMTGMRHRASLHPRTATSGNYPRLIVRCQCGPSSTPMTQSGPTHLAIQRTRHPATARLELRQHLIAHEFVVGPVRRAGWTGGKAASRNQREALHRSTLSCDEQRRHTHARRVCGMLARAQKTPAIVALNNLIMPPCGAVAAQGPRPFLRS